MVRPAEFMLSVVRADQFPPESLPEVAFLGRSNAGKSTLLNCLAGHRKLAFSSATPGRTRALNFFRVDERIVFVDLPGYGHAGAPAHLAKSWGPLVETYLSERRALKLCVFLLDARRGWMAMDLQLKDWLDARRRPYVVVATKVDKLNQKETNLSRIAIREHLAEADPVWFSAVTGQGVNELWQAISKTTAS